MKPDQKYKVSTGTLIVRNIYGNKKTKRCELWYESKNPEYSRIVDVSLDHLCRFDNLFYKM